MERIHLLGIPIRGLDNSAPMDYTGRKPARKEPAMKRAILCFTRVPQAGKTKTRLMPRLTAAQCAGLHWAFLRDLSAIYAAVDADLLVAHTPDPDWECLKDVFPGALFFPQEGSGLGEKMDHALGTALAMGYDRCVLTGSDLPGMTKAHLQSGFDALDRADVTLGPTADGGYYLVGVKEESSFLFRNQTYGGGSVYENALAAIRAAGKTFCPALPCDDVDTQADLAGLTAVLDPGSHTAAYLRSLGESL